MLEHLQEKRDVRFFISTARLMTCCSVLNLDMYERQVCQNDNILFSKSVIAVYCTYTIVNEFR